MDPGGNPARAQAKAHDRGRQRIFLARDGRSQPHRSGVRIHDFTCIDPFPKQFLTDGVAGIGDVIQCPVQDVPLELFAELGDGDVLFIDTSHVVKTGGDVPWIFHEIVPRLRPGVHVHLHGIFLPDEYLQKWVFEGRGWNEQYLVQSFLAFNDVFEVVFATWWMIQRHPQELAAAFPIGCGSPRTTVRRWGRAGPEVGSSFFRTSEMTMAIQANRLEVLAFADELCERPQLLARWAAEFGVHDAVTLLIHPGTLAPEEVAERLPRALAAAGLSADTQLDLQAFTGPFTAEEDARTARRCARALTRKPPAGPFAALLTVTDENVVDLRPMLPKQDAEVYRQSPELRTARIAGADFMFRADHSDTSVMENVFDDKAYSFDRYGFDAWPGLERHRAAPAGRQLIIDAGANIGASSVFFAVTHPQATVLAIEPQEDNFELLVRNTRHLPNRSADAKRPVRNARHAADLGSGRRGLRDAHRRRDSAWADCRGGGGLDGRGPGAGAQRHEPLHPQGRYRGGRDRAVRRGHERNRSLPGRGGRAARPFLSGAGTRPIIPALASGTRS